MGFFDKFLQNPVPDRNESDSKEKFGAIDYGKQKKDGSHDHRTNTGSDRTPSQQEGDKKRRKDKD